jgi:hypothetical protein
MNLIFTFTQDEWWMWPTALSIGPSLLSLAILVCGALKLRIIFPRFLCSCCCYNLGLVTRCICLRCGTWKWSSSSP